jgi:hypothetical protein
MLSFVTSQAIVLSQANQKADQKQAPNRGTVTRNPLLVRVYEAIAESRMRQAKIALELYRPKRADISEK